MHSLALQKEALNFKAIADHFSEADRILVEAVELYARKALSLGYAVQAYSKSSLAELPNVPDAKKLNMAQFLTLSAQWVEAVLKEGGGNIEQRLLKKALDYYGLSVDDDLLNTIDEDTVVEIYNSDMIQLYRSMKMLEMTGYSLLDLSVYEWFVLWERPQLAIQQMYQEGVSVLESEITFKNLNVVPHVLKENLNTGMTEPFIPRNAFVNFQHIGFLKPARLGAPRAMVCTAKGSILAHGFAETSQIAFL